MDPQSSPSDALLGYYYTYGGAVVVWWDWGGPLIGVFVLLVIVGAIVGACRRAAIMEAWRRRFAAGRQPLVVTTAAYPTAYPSAYPSATATAYGTTSVTTSTTFPTAQAMAYPTATATATAQYPVATPAYAATAT